MQFDNYFAVDRIGMSGGLLLAWKDNLVVKIRSYSRYHIDVVISSDKFHFLHFIGFYGNPDAAQRVESWKLLKRIGDSIQGPWIVGGDFNEILSLEEKQGGNNRSFEAMGRFRKAINYCVLEDLYKNDYSFTWCNGHHPDFIMEKLDGIFANSEWFEMARKFSFRYLD